MSAGREAAARRAALAAALSAAGVALLPRRAAAQSGIPIEQPAERTARAFMARAQAARDAAVRAGDQPYGAVIVKDGRIVGWGPSRVVVAGDPTAHAEIEAVRDAARRLGSRDLSGCVLYATSRPCAMCEGALYWARVARIVHGAGLADAGAPRYPPC
ncbi:MAG: nucleoside deaminase [Burkholderiales bacterium]|nr:nucleoside deaminase [Burkholderiales bacterium]